MIVQAGRSISGLNDRRARPTSRSLNYPTRPHSKQNSNFLRAFRPELVLCGTAGLPQANAPPQKLH